MNKAESKYFNTALLMDQALLLLLEKKDLEYITIKELCQKAGVNRSTFYLHYENINDLFNETVEMLNKEFTNSFSSKNITISLMSNNPEDIFFIKPEFIVPYLEFVKQNKRIFKIVHDKPYLFNNKNIYRKMCDEIFFPILSRFNILKEERPFILEFFTKGITAMISKWVELDCELPIEKLVKIIIDTIKLNKN